MIGLIKKDLYISRTNYLVYYAICAGTVLMFMYVKYLLNEQSYENNTVLLISILPLIMI